jgi:hypothetical protein
MLTGLVTFVAPESQNKAPALNQSLAETQNLIEETKVLIERLEAQRHQVTNESGK